MGISYDELTVNIVVKESAYINKGVVVIIRRKDSKHYWTCEEWNDLFINRYEKGSYFQSKTRIINNYLRFTTDLNVCVD